MSYPIFGETLQSNGCRVFHTNQAITIMTDRIHGYYTLDALRMLNPLYDCEHRMKEQDVDAVNALRAHIESTRSFATVVDRIESTGAFDPGRSEYADFLGALAFGRLSQGDLWEYLVDLSRTVALSRAIGGLGFYPVCPARDREKLIALTSRYDEMGASVKRLKEQRRSKDITLNESAKLRMEMKEEERRLRAVADEIKEICNGRSR